MSKSGRRVFFFTFFREKQRRSTSKVGVERRKLGITDLTHRFFTPRFFFLSTNKKIEKVIVLGTWLGPPNHPISFVFFFFSRQS